MKYIDTIEKWNILSAAMQEKGYRIYQTQHDYYDLEGFHAWFFDGKKDVEVYTYNQEVQKAIIAYKIKKSPD